MSLQAVFTKEQEAQAAAAVQAAPSKGAEAVRSRWAAVKP